MKCFLHIGTEKTATTTIQSFLNLNRDFLLSDGYIYTKSLGKINNIRLALAAYNIDRRDNLTRKLGVNSNAKLLQLQKKATRQLKKELEKITDLKSYKIVFSSEHIQSRLTTIEELERLKAILNSCGFQDISVVLYLRNPANIANSLYSTTVKSGSAENSPPPPSNEYYANICNHQYTIEKFASVFGELAIIPKIFDKNVFVNNSIIEDFSEVVGIKIKEKYCFPPNRNESLSAMGIEILRRFNNRVPAFINNKVNPQRANILEYIKENFNDEKYVMPSSLFSEYNEAFAESNEWVRKKYFPDKKSLFYPKPQVTETNIRISDDKLDMIADLLSSIWLDKETACSKLKSIEARLNTKTA